MPGASAQPPQCQDHHLSLSVSCSTLVSLHGKSHSTFQPYLEQDSPVTGHGKDNLLQGVLFTKQEVVFGSRQKPLLVTICTAVCSH